MYDQTLIAILPWGATGMPHDGCIWTDVDGMTAVTRPADASFDRRPASQKRELLALAAYHQALESLQKCGTILPVKQNMMVKGSEILSLIRANHVELTKLAQELEGQDQYQISVSWNLSGVLEHFRDAPEIAHLFFRSRTDPTTILNAVTCLAARLRRFIINKLTEIASDYVVLPSDGETIANVVILLPAEKADALEHALMAVDAIWTEGFRIRQIGPTAAVSFATLHPRWISPAQVQAALGQLGLSSQVGTAEVEAARRTALRFVAGAKEQIDTAAKVLCAAIHSGSDGGFYFCDVWRDGTAQAQTVYEDAH